jgi:hypothetical protein
MPEALARQVAKLQVEVQDLLARLLAKSLGARDTSLISFIPKWTVKDKGVPLDEFLEAVEMAARLGNWSE